ncbi:MAG TPA: hypothetical protein VE127_04310, partial [Solirubrobacteraceae bacterium]|nr:hypothetical protein [Solirubrobacteraceae bacterium]
MSERHRISRSSDDGASLSAGVPPATPAKSRARLRRGRTRTAALPHSGRFRLVTMVLGGLAVAAVVVAVAIATQGRSGARPGEQWSQWSPPESGTLGARDIADYVAPFYRISPIDQLAVVTVVNLESASAAAAAQAAAANGSTSPASSGLQVAVRPSPSSSAVSLLGGNTVAFNLCGIGGKNCAIGVGQPSSNRMLLLRREALELALYTFKYIGGTQNVVAILPPGRTEVTSSLSKSLPTSTAA